MPWSEPTTSKRLLAVVEGGQGLENVLHAAVGAGDGLEVRGGAQRGAVAGVVRLGQPQHGQRRAARLQHVLAEAVRHGRVPGVALLDGETLARRHRAGGSGRTSPPGDTPSRVRRGPESRRRPADTLDITIDPPWAASRSASVGRRKVAPVARRMRSRNSGLAHGETDQPVALVEDHGVAEQPVRGGPAARGDARRGHPRHRGKHAGAGGEVRRRLGEGGQGGAVARVMRSRRRLSQTTRTARRMARSLPLTRLSALT